MARVEVVYSPRAREVDVTALELADGATVLHALRESRLLERHPEIDVAQAKVGVWGRVAPLSQPLREGDRVEVYRPLIVDPKEARRQRYRKQKISGSPTR
jgi:putative ubiquitin-RnfH superfamily antitoxin RatB of RatAB toxin-antitoxin module